MICRTREHYEAVKTALTSALAEYINFYDLESHHSGCYNIVREYVAFCRTQNDIHKFKISETAIRKFIALYSSNKYVSDSIRKELMRTLRHIADYQGRAAEVGNICGMPIAVELSRTVAAKRPRQTAESGEFCC